MTLKLCLAFSFLSAFVLASPHQQFLHPEPEPALLRRFTLNDSRDIHKLLLHAQNHDLDIWQVTPSHVDIYSPSALPDVLSKYPHTQLSIPSPSYDRAVIPPIPRHGSDWNLSSLEESPFHTMYHPLFEIDSFIHDMASLHPDKVNIVPLGHSGEGREMLGLSISQPKVAETANGKFKRRKKKGFVITGAQHAREWVATSTALYLTHALLANPSEPHSLSHLLEYYDFYIVPVPNPDGYDYTWESDRFWYKNRMIVGPHSKCVGLDMNRNWGYKWKRKALDDFTTTNNTELRPKEPIDPCSNWYPGTRPFQAPEVNNIANFVTSLPNLIAFIDLRSYGQMLSSPFSYSCERIPKAAEDQIEAALGATFALRQEHGTVFMTGSLCSMLYRAPGNIVDWMYVKARVKYTYAAFLRDTGTYGFALPPEWIRPVGEETRNMVEYLGMFIWNNVNDK